MDGWIRLPKDADGVTIRLGDMMRSKYTAECQVEGVCVGAFFAWDDEDGCWHQYDASAFVHVKPDSWERIIEDARAYRLNIGGSYLWKNKSDELIARCKELCERTKGGDA